MTIAQKQHLLAYLSYDPGQCDGIDGPLTRRAVERFREDYGAGEEAILDAVAGRLEKKEAKADSFWAQIRYVPRAEWRCPCGRCGGYPAEPEEKLVRFLDELRAHFDRPVYISSGVRCEAHNRELPGSVYNSRHLSGKAVDFCVQGSSSTAVKIYCDKLVTSGVLRYCYCIDDSFVHADIL